MVRGDSTDARTRVGRVNQGPGPGQVTDSRNRFGNATETVFVKPMLLKTDETDLTSGLFMGDF